MGHSALCTDLVHHHPRRAEVVVPWRQVQGGKPHRRLGLAGLSFLLTVETGV